MPDASRSSEHDATVVLGADARASFVSVAPTADRPEQEDSLAIVGTTIDRFEILELLGEGGMGRVYRARDPQLQRDVALKLLVERDAEARLLREARAMARIVHPNILPIFDVGRHADGLFIAMELVEGQTLRSWLRAEPRSVPEVLAVIVAAGRGLQAAHAAGLVHRDFKPSNVMVGDDGRVRVMDLGLARLTGESSTSVVSSPIAASSHDDSLTRSGAVAGSPPYMAPEQHRGAPTDASSDQYAFSVTLWESLMGKRPFRARTYPELVAAKHRGAPELPTELRIPAGLRAVLRRGLAVAPNDRFPSMEALLDELGRQLPHRSTRRHRARVAAFTLLGGAATLGLLYAPADSPCLGAASRLSGIWDAPTRQGVETAVIATHTPHAEDTWQRLAPRLDEYAERWAEDYTEACVATRVRAEQSAALMDARMRCLERGRRELAALARALEAGDAEMVEHAVPAADALPRLERCADLEALARDVPPPDDPAVQREVEALEGDLARAGALQSAGKIDDARTLATRVYERARVLGYEPLVARAALRSGKLADEAGRHDEALAHLTSAYFTAERWGQHEVQANAAIDLVFLLGRRQQQHEAAEQWFKHAEAVVERLDDDELRASLLSNHGGVLEAQARHEEALAALRRALELRRGRGGPEQLDVATTLNNIGIVQHSRGHYDAALESFVQALAIQERALGPRHPQTARSLANVGAAHEAVGRYDEALEHYRRSLSIHEEHVGERHPMVGLLLNNIGIVLEARGDLGPALEHYERALAIREAVLGPDHPDVATSIDSVGGILQEQGRLEAAEAHQRRALAIREDTLGPGHPATAISLNNLGTTLFREGDLREAEDHHRRALKLREAVLAPDHPNVASSHNNLGMVLAAENRHDEALHSFRRALAIWESKLEPDHPHIAQCLTNIAESLTSQGEHVAAIDPLERALAIQAHDTVAPQLRAAARFALARGLRAARRDPARARELAERARDEYVGGEGDFSVELAAIDAWLPVGGAPAPALQ